MSSEGQPTFLILQRETKFVPRNNKWQIIASTICTPDGRSVTWEHLKANQPAVVVIPINSEGRIGVIRQWRQSVGESGNYIWEFPSGWMETDSQDPEEVQANAQRELQEEVGYESGGLMLLSQFKLANFADVPFFVFLATNLQQNSLPGDEPEKLTLEWLSFKDAYKRLVTDQVPTAQVLISLLQLKNYLNEHK